MNISRYFLERKFLLWVIAAILVLGGISYYLNTQRNEDPGFKIRTAVVTSTLKGTSATEIDQLVTDAIEEALEQMDEVENIKSRSYQDKSVVYVEVFETYKELQPIWDKVRRKINATVPTLPKGTTVSINDEFGDVFGTVVALYGDDFNYKELKNFATNLKNEFLKLKDSAKVEILGEQKEAIYIYFDSSKLARLGLSAQNIAQILEQENIILPSGEILNDGRYLALRTQKNFKSIEDIKNTAISLNSNESVRLDDILKIEKKFLEPSFGYAKFNGKNALILAISMKESGNILNFGKEIEKKIKEQKVFLPLGLKLQSVLKQSEYVKYLTDKFTSNLVQSVAIVIGLILLILGAKIGLIVGAIIPLTILGAFSIMGFFDIGLDKISLSALIIALGILVDNSIVISEGIISRLNNENIKEAVLKASEKFQLPLLVSTLCTSLAFLPIYIANSTVSEYTSSLFKVVAATLLTSWAMSVTVLPALCEGFLKNSEKIKKFDISKYFVAPINFSISHPKATLIAALSLTALSFFIFNFVPKIYFPNSDRPTFEIEVNLPENEDILETKATVEKIEAKLGAQKEIKNFSSFIGISAPRYVLSSSPKPQKSNQAMIIVNTKNYKNVEKNIEIMREFCTQNFADANIIVRKVPIGPPVDAPVEIRFFGQNDEELFKIVRHAKEKLRQIRGVTLVKDDWGAKIPNIFVQIDSQSASRYGITSKDVSNALNAALSGQKVSQFWQGTTLVPIFYRFDKTARSQIAQIDTIGVYSPAFRYAVPLSQIARLGVGFEYPKVFRRNGALTITLQGWIDENKTTAHKVVSQMRPHLDKIDYKQGYGWEAGGTVESSKKGINSVFKKIPLAFGLILMLLVWHFNSIKIPLIIFGCALMALSGANFGLFLTRNDFGFMTFLGYVCLVGIATNNAVVLLDEFEKLKDKTAQSIAATALSRATPVSLTALTTIGAMLPLWLGRDPMFCSLAVAIIFGLLSSVPITLFVAPVLYLKGKEKGCEKIHPKKIKIRT